MRLSKNDIEKLFILLSKKQSDGYEAVIDFESISNLPFKNKQQNTWKNSSIWSEISFSLFSSSQDIGISR